MQKQAVGCLWPERKDLSTPAQTKSTAESHPFIVGSSETPKESEADSPVFPCTSAMLGRLTGFLSACVQACTSTCVGVKIYRAQRSMRVFLQLFFFFFFLIESLTQPRIYRFVHVGWPVSLKDSCPPPPCLRLPSAGILSTHHCTWVFCMGSGDQPSGCGACMGSTRAAPHLCLLHCNPHGLFTLRWWSSQPAISWLCSRRENCIDLTWVYLAAAGAISNAADQVCVLIRNCGL